MGRGNQMEINTFYIQNFRKIMELSMLKEHIVLNDLGENDKT